MLTSITCWKTDLNTKQLPNKKIQKLVTSTLTLLGIFITPTLALIQSDTAIASIKTSTIAQTTTANDLSAEIAKVEVERSLLLSRFQVNSAPVKAADNKIQNLRSRLIQLGGNKTALNREIANHIVAKIASLEVGTALLYARYTSDSPIIQAAESDIKNLRSRFSQLQQPNSQTIIKTAVTQALRSKIAEVKKERIRVRNLYQRDSVQVVSIEEQLRLLQKRLAIHI